MDPHGGLGIVLALARDIFWDDSDSEEDMAVQNIKGFAEEIVPRFSTKTFQFHFRMIPEAFENVLIKLNATFHDELIYRRSDSVPLDKELMVTIWYLANMDSYRCVALIFGISKSTCWEILGRTCEKILKMNANFEIIGWPTRTRAEQIMREFEAINGFPGIIGAIDGSHIKIVKPQQNANSYCNRKNYHSVLLQGVCDSRMLFTDVYAGEPGSMHDMRLFKKSDLYKRIQDSSIDFPHGSHLIGDLAYKLSAELLVGFKDVGGLTRQQINFNQKLSECRVKIENAFACLKGRFRRLKFMETIRMDLISLLIVTSCILHNMCILVGDFPEMCDENEIENDYGAENVDEVEDASIKRKMIMEELQFGHNA